MKIPQLQSSGANTQALWLQYSHMYCITYVYAPLHSFWKCLSAMRDSLIDGWLYGRCGRVGHLLALSARRTYVCIRKCTPPMHSQTHTYTTARTHVRSRSCMHAHRSHFPATPFPTVHLVASILGVLASHSVVLCHHLHFLSTAPATHTTCSPVCPYHFTLKRKNHFTL